MARKKSISSTLYVRIFRTNVVFSSYMYVEKTTFVRKIRIFCTYNVDEIDTRFHFFLPLNNAGMCRSRCDDVRERALSARESGE